MNVSWMLSRYVVAPDGCWIYSGSLDREGYGRCGKGIRAHRLFYEHRVGDIPEGHEIHHVCGIRRCVNPEHLLALTREEHMAITPELGWQKNKTHCPHGHQYSPDNTCFSRGKRHCLTCNRVRCNNYYQRSKERKAVQ